MSTLYLMVHWIHCFQQSTIWDFAAHDSISAAMGTSGTTASSMFGFSPAASPKSWRSGKLVNAAAAEEAHESTAQDVAKAVTEGKTPTADEERADRAGATAHDIRMATMRTYGGARPEPAP